MRSEKNTGRMCAIFASYVCAILNIIESHQFLLSLIFMNCSFGMERNAYDKYMAEWNVNLINAATVRWRTTDRRHPQHVHSVLAVGIRKNAVANSSHRENAMVQTGISYGDIGDVYHRHPHRMGKWNFIFASKFWWRHSRTPFQFPSTFQ